MNISENAIKATAKLYEYRDSLKTLWGDQFHSKIETYMQLIQNYSKMHNKEPLICAMEIVKKINDGMYQLIVWAAVTELMEPSEPYKKPSIEERLKNL